MSADISAPAATPEVPWYKRGVIYELYLRGFYDSNGDGIGDLRGAIQKLDYLADLGITTLWLLPFYPSPLRDGGYDVSDYLGVHPQYGTLDDLRELLREAHARDLRVITELVLNHTSDQHPWFQASRRAPAGSPERTRYVWSPTADRYAGARVIFRDFEKSNWTWDADAGAFYWHRFYSHQPDLNFDDPETERAMLEVARHWLQLGVDGLRLDAVPYLYERDGTPCENLPETHAFLRRLRRTLSSEFPDRVLLAEANQWPDDAAAYFGKGDECHLAFHFPLMPRMFMAIQQEDRQPLLDILQATPRIPPSCQWALFLRNHDELTLEMVTDEERDYLYRTYARDARGRINLGIRRRLAPLMGGDRRKIELMVFLLFTLPGTPVLFYGDEILMGDNATLGDRDSVRCPMQWTSGRNGGFSRARASTLYLPTVKDPEYRHDVVNVAGQLRDLSSPLWWTKRLIRMRQRVATFGHGPMELLAPENPRVFAFLRRGPPDVLVATNLSRFAQTARIELPSFNGRTPVDLFGGAEFPPLRGGGLSLAFGPYGYYAFQLSEANAAATEVTSAAPQLARLDLPADPGAPWTGALRERLESEVLPLFLPDQPWFAGRGRGIDFVRLRDLLEVGPSPGTGPWIALADVFYRSGPFETYAIPLALSEAVAGESPEAGLPGRMLARWQREGRQGLLVDAGASSELRAGLFGLLGRAEGVRGSRGTLRGITLLPTSEGPGRLPSPPAERPSAWHLSLRRRLMERQDLEVAMARRLTERGFPHTAGWVGELVYAEPGAEPACVGSVVANLPLEEDLAHLLRREAVDFLRSREAARKDGPSRAISRLAEEAPEAPEEARALLGETVAARLADLGRVVARFHTTLLGEVGEGEFAPVPFGYLYQSSLAYAFTTNAQGMLAEGRAANARPTRSVAGLGTLLENGEALLARLREVRTLALDSVRIPVHGALRLENVWVAGKDLYLVGYGRDPTPVKRSPLRDLVELLRSLQYAADGAAADHGGPRPARAEAVDDWAHVWYRAATIVLRATYEEAVRGSPLVPSDPGTRRSLLEILLLDRCVTELRHAAFDPGAHAELPLRRLFELLFEH